MSKINYLTQDGLKKLQAELDQLTKKERPYISRQIAEARDKGDLSENAEYAAAKEAQGLLELKISKLQEMLQNARLIDETKIETDKVQIMNRVKIKNLKTNSVIVYTLVSEREADIKAGKISVTTPIARGLIGKKVGDTVKVQIPSGIVDFEILEITM